MDSTKLVASEFRNDFISINIKDQLQRSLVRFNQAVKQSRASRRFAAVQGNWQTLQPALNKEAINRTVQLLEKIISNNSTE